MACWLVALLGALILFLVIGAIIGLIAWAVKNLLDDHPIIFWTIIAILLMGIAWGGMYIQCKEDRAEDAIPSETLTLIE